MKYSKKLGIFFAALIVAVGGIIYELIIGTASSYLIGNSIFHFSITIGFFLFGMGIGSWLSKYLKDYTEEKFVIVEMLIAFIGGNSVALIFFTYGYTRHFYLVLISLILIIGVLIGLEIPLLIKIINQKKRQELINNVSNILAIDYLGALFASIVFPIILLPQLGILRTAFAVGFLNLTIAGLIFISFRKSIKFNKILLSFLILIIFIELLLGLLFTDQITTIFDKGIYRDEVIISQQSSYQKIVITKKNDDTRLFLEGNLQFSTIDEYRYHESLVHIPMSLVPKKSNILVLGGGDGLATRELLKYPEVKKITLVDLDDEITSLFQNNNMLTQINQNSLNDTRVEIKNQDAFSYLDKSDDVFNLIIIDLPDPNNSSLSKLYSQEFYELVKNHLTGDGVFVTQATSPYFSTDTFWLIEKTIQSTDLETLPYHVYIPTFGEWGFIIGSDRKLSKNKILLDKSISTRYLDQELIPQFFIFDEDLQGSDYNNLPINSIFTPEILKYYNEAQKQWIP
jgi:spermidine synthase